MDEFPDRSIGELLGDLSRDTAALVRSELELAKVELQRITGRVGSRLAFLAVGAAICHAGLLTLIAAIVLAGVALGLPAFAAAGLVAVLLLAVGGFLTQRGMAGLKAEQFVPRETLRTVRETASWARGQGR